MARFNTLADMRDVAKVSVVVGMLNKRLQACGSGTLALPTSGTANFLAYWKTVQLTVNNLRQRFVQHIDENGDPMDWAGHRVINTWGLRAPASYANTTPQPPAATSGSPLGELCTFEVQPFPLPNGFTREYPRVIKRLSNSGSIGQIARFEASSNTSLTPTNERQYSGQLFEHDGTTWIPDTTGAIGPDRLTGYGLIQTRDYVGLWIANEIEAAIRLFQWADYTVYGNLVGQLQREGSATRGGLGNPTTDAAAKTAAEAAFSAATPIGGTTPPGRAAMMTQAAWTGGGFANTNWLMIRKRAKITISTPTAGGFTRDLLVYTQTVAPGAHVVSTQTGPLAVEPYGDVVPGVLGDGQGLNRLIKEIPATTITSYDSVTADGLYVGDLSTTPLTPWVADPPASPNGRSAGWMINNPGVANTVAYSGFYSNGVTVIAKFDVVGGFDDPPEV